ncbi:MAG: hypothetical protein ACRCUI_01035 [Polymorphobacter sp.]
MPRMLGPKPIIVPPRLPWEPVEPVLNWRQRLRALPRSRWVILGLSFLITTIIVIGFVLDAKSNMPSPVLKLVYAQSWPEARSAADIAASRAQEKADFDARYAASRAHIATLPPAEQAAARDQYNLYAAAQKPSLRPADYVAPKPPAESVAAPAATPVAPAAPAK